MKVFGYLMWLALLIAIVGCSRPDNSAAQPLTMEVWAALPPEKKFEIGTFERLKLGNPKLQDDREWNQFAQKVMLPAKKKERP